MDKVDGCILIVVVILLAIFVFASGIGVIEARSEETWAKTCYLNGYDGVLSTWTASGTVAYCITDNVRADTFDLIE